MANEMMEFPQTIEEYMEQYKIVDSKEIYSNGMEMVPIFRMKQWYEHQMSVEQYRQRMIEAFHNADCDEFIALVALPTEKEFKHLEWLLKTHYKTPKDRYKARLKADMVAMLTELLSEIEEMQSREVWCDYATDNCIDRCGVDAIIRLRINELKGEQMSSISATQYGQIVEREEEKNVDQDTEQTEDN